MKLTTYNTNVESDKALKSNSASNFYRLCRKHNLLSFANRFGLKPELFAENVSKNQQCNRIKQEFLGPDEVAKEYTSTHFQTVNDIMNAIRFVVARQIAHEPKFRKTVCKAYFENFGRSN